MNTIQLLSGRSAFLLISAILLISGPAVSADEIDKLGRLFTDAGQRQKLDAVRRGTYQEEAEQSSATTNVRVNGVMMRSNGENVVWVNGESTLDNGFSKGVKVNPKAADRETYKVPVRVDGKRIQIKPGQSWSQGEDQVKDNYQ